MFRLSSHRDVPILPARRRPPRRSYPARVEGLEPRQMLSTMGDGPVAQPAGLEARPLSGSGVFGSFTPNEIRHLYGVDKIQFTDGLKTIAGDGSGQTIAIIDAYDDPFIGLELTVFDSKFGLPDCLLSKEAPFGTPPLAPSDWMMEIALDVEWGHAIAAKAGIKLGEAKSSNFMDLNAAVDYARAQNASVISMSWGSHEWSTEKYLDSTFKAMDGHPPVAFVASSGDNG